MYLLNNMTTIREKKVWQKPFLMFYLISKVSLHFTGFFYLSHCTEIDIDMVKQSR